MKSMSPLSTPKTNALAHDRDLALMTVDGLNLLLPQGAIRSLEPVLDVEPYEGDEVKAGVLWFDSELWPVHCFDKNLAALATIPESRRVCVVFSAARGYFCVLCDAVRMLRREDVKTTPLPVCMNSGGNPFYSLAVVDRGVGCLTSVDDLMAFVKTSSQGERSETAANTPASRAGQGVANG